MTRLRRAISEVGEAFRITLGTLASHRLRSSLTTLGIVIGVATVIAIVAIIQGLNTSFEESIQGFGTNTLYVARYRWLDLSGEYWRVRNRKPIGDRELRAILRESTVAVATSPTVSVAASVSRGERSVERVNVNGVGAQYLVANGGGVRAGRFFAESDSELSRPSAVLGAEVVDRLFPGVPLEAVLGQRVLVGGHAFSVVGLSDRRGRFLGIPMDNNVLIPYTTFGRFFGSKRPMNIAVAAPPGRVAELEDELTSILRKARQVKPGKPDDFLFNRQDQFLKFYQGLTGALYAVAVGVGFITLIVGGIGIMNIMLVSVHERTREIGLRRALGARRATILTQFLVESALVATLGGAIGTAIGLGVAQFIALLSPLAAAATPSAVALGLGFSSLTGLVFGSWPAWRAANLDPVEALRYE
jgi:putative ABC transport system permease protein